MTGRDADEALRRIEELAEARYLPIVGPARGRILVDVVREFRPKRILEVGALIGYSAILMGRELGGDSEIITIEIDERRAQEARENIRRAKIEPTVRVLTGNALTIIRDLEGWFDLVFLDAAKHQYLDYLQLVEDRLVRGGVVAADNAGFLTYSMRGYLDYVRNSGKYESRFVPGNGDGIEISVKL
jgi:predicted O-methyltransferase YrrM